MGSLKLHSHREKAQRALKIPLHRLGTTQQKGKTIKMRYISTYSLLSHPLYITWRVLNPL